MDLAPLIIPGLGPSEILIIIIFGLILIVGTKKIPELARAVGRSMGEFQKGRQEVEKEIREVAKMDRPLEPSEYDRVVKAAKELGLATEGKTLEQLKEEIKKTVGN